MWVGRPGSDEWKRVERVVYRPDGWKHNGLGHPTTPPAPHRDIFCTAGWEAVVMRGDEVEVRIGSAASTSDG